MNYQLTALAGLSLQHPKGRTPAAPTNEDRLRAFRACVRPELGNGFRWPFQSEKNKGQGNVRHG